MYGPRPRNSRKLVAVRENEIGSSVLIGWQGLLWQVLCEVFAVKISGDKTSEKYARNIANISYLNRVWLQLAIFE